MAAGKQTALEGNAMFSLFIFFRFMLRDSKPAAFKPMYVQTWPDEVPGYPASDFVKNL